MRGASPEIGLWIVAYQRQVPPSRAPEAGKGVSFRRRIGHQKHKEWMGCDQ
jgi:hypothetical protein